MFATERTGASEIFVLNAVTRVQARVTRRTPTGTDTAWSPDGTMIAFDRHYYGYTASARHHELWVMRPDGGDPRAVVRNAGRYLLMPSWSPDCRSLAYVRGGRELVIVDVRRGTQRTIAQGKWLAAPTWSPDSRRIAFAQAPSPDFSYRVHHRSQIFVVGANGRGKRKLVVGGMPAWSPKGPELAYVVERRIPARRLITENELRVVRVDERRSSRLTSPARDNMLIRDPAWSPDGKQLVARRDDYQGDLGGLVVMSADGSSERIVVSVGYWEYAGHPAWSPGGETIVFDESAAIHAVDSSGANRRVLRVGNRDSDPAWSPDRRSIAFHRTAGYSSIAGGFLSEEQGLYVVSSNARTMRKIRGVGYGDSDGSGERPAWSPNGRWIAYEYGNAGIALHDVTTDRGRVLVCERAPGNECDGRGVYAPAWLPSSKEVLYWGTLDSDPMSLSSRRLSGRAGRFLRDSPCTGDQPVPFVAADASPDGRWLLITALRKIKSDNSEAFEPEVWRIPLRGCGGRFTSRPGGARGRKLAEGRDAVWSPDGTRVAFVKRVGGDDEIYVMRSDGSHERALTANSWDDEQPDW